MTAFRSRLLLFGFLFCFLPADIANADWTSIQLTTDNYAESMPAVALDSNDTPNFAWCSNDDGDYDIYYLSGIAGTPVMVTDNGTEDLYPCLKFDQNDFAHIVFKGDDGHDYEEFYMNNVSGDFCEPIQVSFTSTNLGVFVPERSSFAIDSAGIIHVVYKYGYAEYGNWDIFYVNNEGGEFGEATRITYGDRTNYNRASIALDENDDVHLVFENGANIVYTNNVSGSFDALEVVSVGTIRWHSSLGIDSSNIVHISYAGYHGGVFYINNAGGSFESTVVISTSNSVNGPTVIALDHNDNVHIAYIGGIFGNTNSHELYYVNDILGNFEGIEQLTFNDEHDVNISLCVDASCNGHIAYLEGYYGSTDYEVWYITNRGFTGIFSDPDRPDAVKLTNYPNPFNPSTTISFNLNMEDAENAEITIYDISGKRIRQYAIRDNQRSIVWDGTDENSQPVSSGMYFYKLRAGNESIASRMLLLK